MNKEQALVVEAGRRTLIYILETTAKKIKKEDYYGDNPKFLRENIEHITGEMYCLFFDCLKFIEDL